MAETRAGEFARDSIQLSLESSMKISVAVKEPGKDSSTESSSYGNMEEAEQGRCPTASLDEIEHRYFSYETPLPEPNNVRSSADQSPVPPPPPPDLHPFTDPHLWPESRKNLLLGLSCVATALTAYSSGAFSPPSERMATAFGLSQTGVLACGITVFCIGFALAPMLLAPLSEYNGRYPVFAVSGVIFVVFMTLCGAAPDIASMSIFRLFVGVGGSVFSTMIGGVIADMWHAEGRNRPMAIFSGAVMAGTGLGPFISSIITYHTTAPHRPSDIATDPGLRTPWRWVFWHQAIMNAVFMAVLVALFRESRGSVLLSRKARALNRWYEAREAAGYIGVFAEEDCGAGAGGSMAVGEKKRTKMNEVAGEKGEEAVDDWVQPLQDDKEARRSHLACRRIRWVVKDDEGRTSVLHMMSLSLYRPFHMLFTEPVVFFFSLWVAFSWAMLYLTFGSIFFVFSRTYGWDMEKCGRVFLAMVAASALATVMGLIQDRVLVWLAPRWLLARLRFDVPERRLYASCLTSILLPAGLFIFGFGARPSVHWFVPTFGIALATMGIYSIYLSTFNYLADVYHRFASSALAAQSCCRNLLGGVFPLVMRPLFANLGNGRAGALLGGIAMGLTLVPWVLVFFGETIRKRSKFAMSLEHT